MSDSERRGIHRREEDTTAQEALDTGRTIFRTLTRTGRIATAVGSICLFAGVVIGAVSTATKMPAELKRTRAELDTASAATNRRVDSVHAEVSRFQEGIDSIRISQLEIKGQLALLRFSQCIVTRRVAPDARADGCDATKGGNSNSVPDPAK